MYWLPIKQLVVIVLSANPFKAFVLGDRCDLDRTADNLRAWEKSAEHYSRVDKNLTQFYRVLNRHRREDKRSL